MTEQTKVVPRTISCGGCGNSDPDLRCFGCLHDFGCCQGPFVVEGHCVACGCEPDATPAPVQGSGGEGLRAKFSAIEDEILTGELTTLQQVFTRMRTAALFGPPSPGSEGVEGAGERDDDPEGCKADGCHVLGDNGRCVDCGTDPYARAAGTGEQAGEVEPRIAEWLPKLPYQVADAIRQQASALAQARAECDQRAFAMSNAVTGMAVLEARAESAEARAAAAVELLRGARPHVGVIANCAAAGTDNRTPMVELRARIDTLLAESGGEGGDGR